MTIQKHSSALLKRTRGIEVLEGAGVRLRRLIGTREFDHVDPFVLLDEFRSCNPEDYIRGFPMHPHRGIETITYMIHGGFRHKDSEGNGGQLTDGCTQWMTAGRGILHSEMPERTKGLLWGYQLWLSLPAQAKMTAPRYQHISPEAVPTIELKGVEIKIISGQFGDIRGPAENIIRTDYFDVRLERGKRFHVPADSGSNRFCYVHTGSIRLRVGERFETVHQGELIPFSADSPSDFRGLSDRSGFLFLSAAPNDEPIVRGGPFVMNTSEEIAQAFVDFQNGILHRPPS